MDFSSYVSPLSWRYGSEEMRRVFSEQHRFELWRRIWVALAEAEHAAGLVTDEELADLRAHEAEIDIARILEIEQETRHDVVAAIREFAEKATVGGGKIHLGATSMDVVDNAEALRVKEALALTAEKLRALLTSFADKIEQHADLACIGYTHLQPAEPTTVGYRLAFYAQDLLAALEKIEDLHDAFQGKGLKGAVGTAASYHTLLTGTDLSWEQLEAKVMKKLDLRAALVSSQVAPRSQEYRVLSALVQATTALGKFAADVRILQSANFGEWSEPFGEKQVGSSAMPFKKNPMNSEKLCSLARYVAALPPVLAENAALSHLERTLDDSANRRILVSEAFLATDEILRTAQKVLDGLVINTQRVSLNSAQYGPFAATEAILMEAVKAGGNRQVLHEVLREISLSAWEAVQTGKPNPLPQLLPADARLTKYLPPERITELMDVTRYVGIAPERSREMAKRVRSKIKA